MVVKDLDIEKLKRQLDEASWSPIVAISHEDVVSLLDRLEKAEATLQRVRKAVEGPHPSNSGLDSYTLAHVVGVLDA